MTAPDLLLLHGALGAAAPLEPLPATPHPLEKVDAARLAASLAAFFGDGLIRVVPHRLHSN